MKQNKERLHGMVKKGWGYELIWATNDLYCGKIMVFEKAGNKFSMHFHREKDETWFVNSGKFKLRWIDTENALLKEAELKEGDVWHNPPLQPHQLEALTDGASISEVSTPDSIKDNYRIIPGDSQIDPNDNNTKG
jgi:mannose-6-phosphate isomerase-like protein (cupin superfamily)